MSLTTLVQEIVKGIPAIISIFMFKVCFQLLVKTVHVSLENKLSRGQFFFFYWYEVSLWYIYNLCLLMLTFLQLMGVFGSKMDYSKSHKLANPSQGHYNTDNTSP